MLGGPAPDPLPVRVRIPDLGIDTQLIELGLTEDGALEVPADFSVGGWYTGGPRPGENGPAVIAALRLLPAE